LGHALLAADQAAQAADAFRRGHELGSKKLGWNLPSAEWLQKAEAAAARDALK
jgi:hypothetical protein